MTITARPRVTPGVLAPPWDLSDRELEVLQLVASDATDAEVAAELYLSTQTVQTHMKNIRRKLDVGSRTGAVVKAIRAGVIR